MGSGIMKNSSLILADELHKPVIKKFNKRKVYSQFKDNIWGVHLADMQSLSKKNKGIKYLLCAIDLFSKYAFVVPLKDKKGTTITNAFDKIIKQSGKKPNKIWVDQGSEFHNRDFKKWLSGNDIEMCSTFNENKSVVAERFIRTLKNKLYKHMTVTNKYVYYDVLDDIVDKYNSTKHSTIKMKPVDVKGYTPNWSTEIFIINKINNTVPYTYNIKDLNDEKIIDSFYVKELQKTKNYNKTKFSL